MVARGRILGIYNKWEEGARLQVDGFSGALYKSFASMELAERWWAEQSPGRDQPQYHFEPQEIEEVPSTGGRFYTYLIVDPRSGLPFYVGQTQDMEARKLGHLRPLNGPSKRYKYKQVIAAIQAAGLEPEFRVVDEQASEADSRHSETEWVKRLAAQGIQVMNRWREHLEWMELLNQ